MLPRGISYDSLASIRSNEVDCNEDKFADRNADNKDHIRHHHPLMNGKIDTNTLRNRIPPQMPLLSLWLPPFILPRNLRLPIIRPMLPSSAHLPLHPDKQVMRKQKKLQER